MDAQRTTQNAQRSFVLWLTGLSGSGKTTLAEGVYDLLKKRSFKVENLDGDIMRQMFPGTGFSKEERDNHIKRAGHLSHLLEKNDVIVIAAFISPYRQTRNYVRGLCENFVEVHVDCSLEVCEKRDPKGLYEKARAGKIQNFTGIDDPYEPPLKPEIIIETDKNDLEECVKQIIAYLERFF